MILKKIPGVIKYLSEIQFNNNTQLIENNTSINIEKNLSNETERSNEDTHLEKIILVNGNANDSEHILLLTQSTESNQLENGTNIKSSAIVLNETNANSLNNAVNDNDKIEKHNLEYESLSDPNTISQNHEEVNNGTVFTKKELLSNDSLSNIDNKTRNITLTNDIEDETSTNYINSNTTLSTQIKLEELKHNTDST